MRWFSINNLLNIIIIDSHCGLVCEAQSPEGSQSLVPIHSEAGLHSMTASTRVNFLTYSDMQLLHAAPIVFACVFSLVQHLLE